MRKYEFTGETKQWSGVPVRQIRRLSDGELGGWIEKEENLSHEGSCWIGPDAIVLGGAVVRGKAKVHGGFFAGGEFRGGKFRGGNFFGGEFFDGKFHGGRFLGGTFRGGTFFGGNFFGKTFFGGDFFGENFHGGDFFGGDFRGGDFRGGAFRNPYDYLVINGLCYTVTLTNDGYANVGCRHHKIAEFLAIKDFDEWLIEQEEGEKMLRFLRPIAKKFCEYHGIKI